VAMFELVPLVNIKYSITKWNMFNLGEFNHFHPYLLQGDGQPHFLHFEYLIDNDNIFFICLHLLNLILFLLVLQFRRFIK